MNAFVEISPQRVANYNKKYRRILVRHSSTHIGWSDLFCGDRCRFL